MIKCLRVLLPVFVLVSVPLTAAKSESKPGVSLSEGLRPFVSILTGAEKQFDLSGEMHISVDGRLQRIEVQLTKFDDQQFDLRLAHEDYAVDIRRRADSTTMIMPLHNVAFRGSGTVTDSDSLAPRQILKRLVSPYSQAATAVTLLSAVNPDSFDALIFVLKDVLSAKLNPQTNEWQLKDDAPFRFPHPGRVTGEAEFGRIRLGTTFDVPHPENDLDGMRVVEVPRSELERTLLRGVHRATEVLAPAPSLKNPRQTVRRVPHGELRWIDGHRVALLSGTPEQMGTAHGKLLKEESLRCIESVLYSFGTAHAIQRGRWFRHDLEKAWARLSPHIPDRHKAETVALAQSLGLQPALLHVLNVFPELFHCSGFAVFDSATTDGKLYHGRVLDYMTTIGLQDAATTFIVKPDGYNAFANIGYAAFIGSVSGMNDKAVSLGEMGGRGEGNWDGVPMATLMRRALEECGTLDEVKRLWSENPRTCEYFYVFADGKTNEAVGVGAWPDRIEFIEPGQTHERLGAGIPDAVVLSAGSRLEHLRQRVQEHHGRIDVDTAKWFMSRPVAMQSNLHNVLFIPADGILYVANASHDRPAAEQPWVKLDLNQLLKSSRVDRTESEAAEE